MSLISINEPMTLVTDYLIFILSFLFFYKLKQGHYMGLGLNKERPIRLWAYAFLCLSFSSFFGGTYHGFENMLPEWSLVILWKATVYCIGGVSFLMVWGSSLVCLKPRWQKKVFYIILIQLVLYSLWMIDHNEFKYVIMNYAPSMLMVFFLHLLAWRKRNKIMGLYVMSGVLISFFAAFVQQMKWGFSEFFNHNDVYHVIQMLGIYLFYRGVLLFEEMRVH